PGYAAVGIERGVHLTLQDPIEAAHERVQLLVLDQGPQGRADPGQQPLVRAEPREVLQDRIGHALTAEMQQHSPYLGDDVEAQAVVYRPQLAVSIPQHMPCLAVSVVRDEIEGGDAGKVPVAGFEEL